MTNYAILAYIDKHILNISKELCKQAEINIYNIQ